MNGYGIAAAAILGPVGVFLAVAIFLRVLERHQHQYSVAELQDLSRDDIDPHWPQVRETLGDPPPSWDPCIVRDPRTPQRKDSL